MKKTLVSVAVMMAGSAFATPFNAGDSRTFSMGGIGVSSADAGQSSIMNPALLATDLRRDLFSLDIDLITISPKVGGFGKIANDYLDTDIVNRGLDIFTSTSEQVTGTGGLIELGNTLQANVDGLGFTNNFGSDTPLTVPTANPVGDTATFITQVGTLNTQIGVVTANINTTATDLGETKTTLVTISSNTLSLQTKLTTLEGSTTTELEEVTADLNSWLKTFASKDAYVEASVLPISFALPSREFGFGIHLSDYIQFGATLNLTSADNELLTDAVDDSTGLISQASTSIGGAAGSVSSDTNSDSNLITDLSTVETNLADLATAMDELSAQLDILTENAGYVDGGQTAGPDGNGNGTSDFDEISNAQAVIEGTADAAGSVAKVTAAQTALTEVNNGSLAALGVSVTAVTGLSDDITDALADVTGYTGENGYVNGAGANISTDDLESTVRVAVAAISEVGISMAKEFVISGQTVSIGITPKVQIIMLEDHEFGLNDVDTSSIGQNLTPLLRANIDVGIAKEWDFHGRVKAGATIKNLIPYTLTSPLGVDVNLRPKMRVGVSHHTEFSTIGADLDITNNSPFYFGIPTREVSLGGELSLWGHAALRAGAHWNVSDPDETGVFTTGLGLTPFGTGLNFAFWLPFDAFSADYSAVIADLTDGELSSALTTGDKLLRDFGFSANLQIAW